MSERTKNIISWIIVLTAIAAGIFFFGSSAPQEEGSTPAQTPAEQSYPQSS